MTVAAKIDPSLRRRLTSAAGSGEAVELVVAFRAEGADDADGAVASPAATRRQAKAMMGRVAAATGQRADDFHVMANLGMVAVSAGSVFVTELLRQPEVVSAVSNAPSRRNGHGNGRSHAAVEARHPA